MISGRALAGGSLCAGRTERLAPIRRSLLASSSAGEPRGANKCSERTSTVPAQKRLNPNSLRISARAWATATRFATTPLPHVPVGQRRFPLSYLESNFRFRNSFATEGRQGKQPAARRHAAWTVKFSRVLPHRVMVAGHSDSRSFLDTTRRACSTASPRVTGENGKCC
jgi:hypothetical protein